MSKFLKVQQGILGLGPGEYQRFCADYIIKKKRYKNMHDIGSKEGTDKTTKGIPDSYNVNEDGTYSLIMYGTVEKQSISKLEKDIKDAHSESKTGISPDKIKEIICFHTNTNIKPGKHQQLITLYKDTTIELIDIDSMAHDICENYPSLMNDYFQIPVDTNQISDIDSFISRYDKFSVSSPLDIEFIERKEKEEIIKIYNNTETLLILTGKPGIGKTKIAVEICKYLEKSESICCLCIRPNGKDIYDDIKAILENNKNYLVFIDDINNLHQMQSFIDCVVTHKNKNIKVIATIRDYLLNEYLNKLNACNIKPSVYELKKMEDDDIINVLENSFNIKNTRWQQHILKISNGNPRIAIMASKSILEGKIESLNSILDVFKNYYDGIIEENKLSTLQIKILFYLSILSPFSIENNEIKSTLENMGIFDIKEYKFLRNLELIEFYNDEAIKICDQNFSNYIIYKYLIELKEEKISDLLMKTYPKFLRKFLNAINMINELFYSKETLKYIVDEINIVWNKEEYTNDELFFKSFHNINIPKTLSILNEKINAEQKTDIPKELKYNENVYINNEIIEVIADLKNTDYSEIAFKLLLSYLTKRPDLYNEIFKSIKESWLMNGQNQDFEIETKIISLLFDRYNKKDEYNEILKLMLVKSVIYCLGTKFQVSEQGKDFKTISIFTITLQPNEELFQFRKYLFNVFINIYKDDPGNLGLLTEYSIWSNEDEQIDILKNDIQILEKGLFLKWEEPNISQCIVLDFIEKMCQKKKIPITKSITNYNKNKEYIILKSFENYDYNEDNTEFGDFLANSSEIDYEYYFKVLKKVIDDEIRVDDWKIQNSIAWLFKYIINNKIDIFKKVFTYYLKYDCPFKSYPNYLFLMDNKYEIIDLLLQFNSASKYFFLSFLLNSLVDYKYVNNIKDFIKEQQNNKYKYTINLSTIVNYSKFDSTIIDSYTKEIIESNDLNLLISYANCLNDNSDEILKIYNAFNNKEMLEELYLKVFNGHVDYTGYMGFLLVKNNYKFFGNILKSKSTNFNRKIIEYIWKDSNSSKLVLDIYNELVYSSFGYFDFHYLFNYFDDNIKEIQNHWIKNYIKENKANNEDINNIFYVICERDEKTKEEIILFLLSLTDDLELFKSIPFFSYSESWSNSKIPLIENKINFLESLKNKILIKSDIRFISHIDYLSSVINGYRDEIKRRKIEEYLDDFYN